MKNEVRPVRSGEIDAVITVLRAAGLGMSVGRLLEFPLGAATGEVLVALRSGRVAGGAAVAGFGATGWIGALGVDAGARRHGLGTALTEGCVSWLRGRGVRTVLLYATPAGRPIYTRVGFADDGDARAWRDVAPPRDGRRDAAVRPLAASDLGEVRALDAWATGEDRGAVFDALGPRVPGLVVAPDGRVVGSAVRSPWGLGPSVVAAREEAGLALLAALRRVPGPPLTVSLPEANVAGVQALRAWGFAPINQATRMRLGPPPAYDPACVFGMFNLFWG